MKLQPDTVAALEEEIATTFPHHAGMPPTQEGNALYKLIGSQGYDRSEILVTFLFLLEAHDAAEQEKIL